MATEAVKVLIDIAVKGREHVKGAVSDIKEIDSTAQKATGGIGGLSRGLVAATGVIVGAAFAAKQLYGVLREGAQLQTITQRFDKLSDSIGTTADTMLGKLKEATQGMISDMDLMSSASQIMNLKLAENEDQVIRLATVAGTLNWDMQQVILTFANMSTMRLDALGLSVSEVKDKAKELEAAGMSAQEAFKEAVILAGEARLDIGGVSENEQAFKQLEAAIANSKNTLVELSVELADAAGLIDAIGRTAGTLTLINQIKQLGEEGRLTWDEMNKLLLMLMNAGPEAAAAMLLASGKMIEGITAVDNALLYNQNAWAAWATGISVNAGEAAAAAIRASTEIFRAMTMGGQSDWFGGGGAPSPLASNVKPAPFQFPRGFAAQMDMAHGSWTDVITAEEAATTGAYSYAAAVDTVAQAHAAMVQTFDAEASAKLEDGFIGADGLVNIEAANKALYEQAKAAGASAGELALLGVATGQLTEEQAKAALKAAILMEKIKQLAASVVSGDISIGDAVGGLGGFSEQLNSGAISGAAGGIEGLAQAAQAFAEGEYTADMQADGSQAFTVFESMNEWLKRVTGTFHTNLVVTTTGAPVGDGGGGGAPAGPPITPAPGGAQVDKDMVSGRSGGAVYNVTVSNYIDGKSSGRGSLDDVTADKTRAALMSLGLLRS